MDKVTYAPVWGLPQFGSSWRITGWDITDTDKWLATVRTRREARNIVRKINR